jgi:class 3 adenylate cyclase
MSPRRFAERLRWVDADRCMQKNHEKPHDISGRPLPGGTVTFLFTDIEGSTRLLACLREGYGDVLQEHHRTLRAAFAEHDGREVHTEGERLLRSPSRARTDAIAAAVAAQRALAAHPWPEASTCGCAWACTPARPRSAPTTNVGMDVHRAARICSAAHGGQVLLSSATRELVVAELGAGVALDDLGEHRSRTWTVP